MIIVKLQGGIGNQLFQYALGQSLKKSFNQSVYYDISSLSSSSNHTSRIYTLEQFGIKARISPGFFVRYLSFHERLSCAVSKILGLNHASFFYYELSFDFKPIELKNRLTVLEGYWQSPKYFQSINDLIVAQIFSLNRLSTQSQLFVSSLKGKTTVSLHFRRGDYVEHQSTNDFHGVCEMDYYRIAMKYLENIVQIDTYVVFSDDVDWVKDNLLIEKHEVVYGSDYALNDVDELLLMATCRHNIIANSTYSWWGAYLNPNSEKIVIAPKKWFNDLSVVVEDLFPPNWVRL